MSEKTNLKRDIHPIPEFVQTALDASSLTQAFNERREVGLLVPGEVMFFDKMCDYLSEVIARTL